MLLMKPDIRIAGATQHRLKLPALLGSRFGVLGRCELAVCSSYGRLYWCSSTYRAGLDTSSLLNTAVLSADTARKQAKHHPEVTQEDYALAQKVIDTAESKTQESANKLKYVLKRKGYTLIVKATKVGDELFIVSLRRSKKERGDT